MKWLAPLLLLITSHAFAGEAETACELFKAKAAITSSLLASPYVYGSSNESNTATLALGYSLSGRSRGNLAEEIAQAKCESFASTSVLEEQQKWILMSVYKMGARDEVKGLLATRLKVLENIDLLEAQLKTQNTTLTEYNSAKQMLVNIDSKISQLKMLLAEPTEPVDFSDIKKLLGKAKTADSKVAVLTAKQEAASGWDVTLNAGTQKDLVNNSAITPFAGVTFKWSFGNMGMDDKIARVQSKTEQLFSESKGGYVQNANRMMQKITEVNALEAEREQALSLAINDTKKLMMTFKDLDTLVAVNMRRALSIQAMTYIAELDGIRARRAKYTEILAAQ